MSKSKYDGVDISAQEKRTEDGYSFAASTLLTIPNSGGRGNWLLETGNKPIIVESRTITTNGNELTYQAFANPVISDKGTPVTVSPFNVNKSLPTTVKIFSSPTITSNGQALVPSYMPGSQGQGNRSVGQLYSNGFVNILPPNSVILATVTNDGTENNAKCELYLVWSEVKDPNPFTS